MRGEGSVEFLRVSRDILPGEQDRYLEIPVDLPRDTEEIEVEISVAGPSGTVIDLGLRDPRRIRGWSGGSRRRVRLGLGRATPGYEPGPMPEGTWAVLLGTYSVPEPGCCVELRVRRRARGLRWLSGELHAHTNHSDGSDTPDTVAREVAELGLDFIALTDHNTGTAFAAFPVGEKLFAIPGMEWTTLRGHVNLYGVERPLDDFRAATEEDVRTRIAEARGRGALVSLCHPFEDMCKGCDWGWGLADLPIDAVEIWNGFWRPSNQNALEWWQSELAAGRRLVAVGGSDRHTAHPYIRYGTPTNWVLAASRTAKDVLEAIRQGRVSLSVDPQGPLLDLGCGPYRMGDLVARAERSAIRLTAQGLRPGDEVRLVSDRGTERAFRADGEELATEFDPDGRRFWRAEVHRYFEELRCELPAGFSNPIYRSAG